MFNTLAIGSQLGTAGGAAVAAIGITQPVTGAFVTGGTGGGGLPAAAAAGTNGGAINAAGSFPALQGGQGSATATVPADFGKAGFRPLAGLAYFYGGTGSASTHGTALTTGLVQGRGGDAAFWFDRLRGFPKRLRSDQTSAETSPTDEMLSMNNTDFVLGADTSGSVNYSTFTYANWAFRRASGFMDVVCYTGTGSATTQAHNLTVVPELMIIKRRNAVTSWSVYTAYLPASSFLQLSDNSGDLGPQIGWWNNTRPTSSVFTVGTDGDVNASGATYVAYLFATVAGVSKVGSYTGTGTAQTINCGFTAGARFVMIKRTDSAGDWWVWDTARGMVTGTDPRLAWNSTAAQANNDWVFTTTGGFQIVTTDAGVNASGGNYIFLAVA
jgi:hypothetical protein